MSIISAIVLFAVIWFMVLLLTLQAGLRTQADEGEIEPGTHSSAPANFNLPRKMWITTAITVVLFAVIAGIIVSGAISVRDLDWFNRMPPETGR